MLHLLFPPKCVLCRKILKKNQQDLCDDCRKHTQNFTKAKRNIPFVAHWTCLWYYKDNVAKSIQRYKFGACRHYAPIYAQYMAARISEDFKEDFNIISWVPVSRLRRFRRGYDQSQLLAMEIAKLYNHKSVQVLKKVRHNRPQSGIAEPARRRANVLGAYKVLDAELVRGKRILLVDDVITTGATTSECARTLLIAGAKSVSCIAVASAVRQ